MKSVEIELPGCNIASCALHTEREWPILEEICSHLDANLERLVVHFSSVTCSGSGNKNMWIDRFAEEKMRKGINICSRTGNNDFSFWAATSDTRMDKLIKRTVEGDSDSDSDSDSLYVRIYGLPGLRIPNVLEMLSNLAEDDHFWLKTNIKLNKIDSMDHLKYCDGLELLNKEPIEEDEVITMNDIFSQICANPTWMSLDSIRLPEVSS